MSRSSQILSGMLPVALGLGMVMVGAFDDRGVQEVAALAPEEEPFLLLPVGRP